MSFSNISFIFASDGQAFLIGLSIGLVPDLFFFRLSHLLQEPCPFLIGLSLEAGIGIGHSEFPLLFVFVGRGLLHNKGCSTRGCELLELFS